jgi:cellobiose-specific phosphotransferase system component IIB
MFQTKIAELSSSPPNKTANKKYLRIYKILIKSDETLKQSSQSYDISLIKPKLNYEYHTTSTKNANDHQKPKTKQKPCSALKLLLNCMLGFLISTLL